MKRDPLYLRCDCHQPHHFVLIEDDPDIAGLFQVSVVGTKSASFWHRVKWAWKHVFAGEHLTVADLILTSEDAGRLVLYILPELKQHLGVGKTDEEFAEALRRARK